MKAVLSLPPPKCSCLAQFGFSFKELILMVRLYHSERICCCLVSQSGSSLCDPMDCSTPAFPVLHYLPEFDSMDTTEQFHFHFSLSCIGEGNGNPLQCSCLENPRDRGAWWAAVYGVAQSRTLMRLSSSSSIPREGGYIDSQCLSISSWLWNWGTHQCLLRISCDLRLSLYIYICT